MTQPKSKIIKIGTLGPSGTNSERAANYYLNQCISSTLNYGITLYNSFQSVLACLINNEISIAIVPHSYSGINEFYINPNIGLSELFTFKTAPYGLVKKPKTTISKSKCRIAVHSASASLLAYLLSDSEIIGNYQISFVTSTSLAAKEVHDGKADIALTNMDAAEKLNLQCIALYGAIEMGWSAFALKKNVRQIIHYNYP